MTFALLPVKNPRAAMQRLAPVLSPAERETLAHILYAEMLDKLMSVGGLDRVVVAADDADVLARARSAGAATIEEPDQRGHAASADRAAERCTAMGATCLALLPIDVPLATPAEIEALVSGAAPEAPASGLVIVPSPTARAPTHSLRRRPRSSPAVSDPAASPCIAKRLAPAASPLP